VPNIASYDGSRWCCRLDGHYHFTTDQMDELKRKFQGYRKEYHAGEAGRMNV